MKRRTTGFTLVEVIVGLAILGTVVISVATLMKNTGESAQLMTVNSFRDEIKASIDKAIGSYDNIVFAANNGASAGNTALQACITPGPPNCTAIGPANRRSFDLTIRRGGLPVSISGTLGIPVLYSRQGVANCNPLTEPGCPLWRAIAYFWADCPGGVGSCPQAQTIYVMHQVSPTRPRLRVDEPNSPLLRAVPTDAELAAGPRRFAISHRVTTREVTAAPCRPGSHQYGVRADGSLMCRCQFGFTQSGVEPVTGHPICDRRPLICQVDQLFRGRTIAGEPICTPTRRVCQRTTFATDSATCPNTGWLTAINLGRCTAGPASKKSDTRGIKCDRNEGTCCFYQPL